ncbi:MAG: M15 family metallopeptidase [Butyrivibrio sp.]|nr:M15 family metallopeptidase [Acetatifactor muris]MCM1560539.1 M15 family metallopeptidase [Butyrivibrio sp.]
MKMTLEERFRKKLLKIGKKNRFLRFCIIPVMAAGMFFFHAVRYFRGNGKRFIVLATTFCLFAVYSSFSFPMFVSGAEEEVEWNAISDEARDIVLAEEVKVDLAELELLEDEDVLFEGEEIPETVHGMDIGERYSASDILEYNQDRLPTETYEAAEAEAYEDYEFSPDDWRLILINKQNSIPEGYEEEVPLGNINTMKGVMHCDERIIDDLLAMTKAAKEDGVILQICSPYRDLEYQEVLFNRKIKYYMNQGLSYMEAYQRGSQVVTVPNASEHQLGLALDIVSDDFTRLVEEFEDTEAGKWLAANSYRYGFILRYPKDKEDITGITYEPWHFRYVGVEAATLITEHGITLEEFWEEYL